MKDNCKQLFAQCTALARRYRYVLLLAALGLALCDAVRALTGLRADQITVVKMKST